MTGDPRDATILRLRTELYAAREAIDDNRGEGDMAIRHTIINGLQKENR